MDPLNQKSDVFGRDLGEKRVCNAVELENAGQKVGKRRGRSGRSQVERCDGGKKSGRSRRGFGKRVRIRVEGMLELEAKKMKNERSILIRSK